MGSPYGRRTHDEADRILGLCSRSRHGKPDGRVELEGRPRRGVEAINVPSPSRPMVSFPDPRASHPYHMHDMILGQPEFIRATQDRVREADVRRFLGRPRRIIVTGCGTSYHAATYGARVLQSSLGARPAVHAIHAYDLLRDPAAAGDTVLAVSHSGNTPTTNRALRRAKARGARALALSGLPGTPMERIATSTLVIGSTHDRSWANTMSYTTQLAAFAGLALLASEGSRGRSAWRSLPSLVAKALETEAAIRALAAAVAAR